MFEVYRNDNGQHLSEVVILMVAHMLMMLSIASKVRIRLIFKIFRHSNGEKHDQINKNDCLSE